MNYIKIILLPILIFLVGFTSCREKQISSTNKKSEIQKILPEANVLEISLEGEINDRSSELSGLAWYKDKLILLPQFPNKRQFDNAGTIYSISKQDLINYVEGETTKAITPEKIKFIAKGLEQFNTGGSGYEAIIFIKDTVYVSIESFNGNITEGYVVKGLISTENNSIELDSKTLTQIPLNINLFNSSCETILNYNQNIITIFEANGKNINPNANAYEFDKNLTFFKYLPFPTIEYRITDATSVNNDGTFWVINYYFPGDKDLLNPAIDSLKLKYGTGKTHLLTEVVERLIELKIEDSKIVETAKPPIYLKLDLNKPSNNWEGIAKLDKLGFLIATDTYPETILAFVALQ